MTSRRIAVPLGLLMLAILGGACGNSGSGSTSDSAQPVPSSADFPSPKGKSLLELKHGLGPGPVLAPTVSIIGTGRERYGFGLFDRARKQISQAPVALYIERSGSRTVTGPFVAQDLPLTVKPAFQSETVAKDPAAAKSLYVAHLRIQRAGDYAVMGVAKLDGRLVASDPVYMGVGTSNKVPQVGQQAPRIDTPTAKSVGGNVSLIDTRTPPDSMHDVNFADAYKKKPVMLLFATPALCQSRVCGPVVDIAEELKSEQKGNAAFIHMEIYRDNKIRQGCLDGTRIQNQCLRPQVLAYHLPTEPWLFAIDRHGKIVDRIEGAFSKDEFATALKLAESR